MFSINSFNSKNINLQKLELGQGIKGFGIYVKILLKLSEVNGEMEFDMIPLLAREIYCKLSEVEQVVKNYSLFNLKEKSFYSVEIRNKLANQQEIILLKSKAGKISAEKRKIKTKSKPSHSKQISTPVEHLLNTCSTPVEHMLSKKPTKVKTVEILESIDLFPLAQITKDIFDYFNLKLNPQLDKSNIHWVSYGAWEKEKNNIQFWLKQYTLEEIKKAIDNYSLCKNNYWNKQMTLVFMFRQSNKAGTCDYIADLLKLKPKEEAPKTFNQLKNGSGKPGLLF